MADIVQLPLSRLKYFKTISTAGNNSQVDAMAADIKRKGIRKPLIVRPVGDLYEVVCGLVRWKGALVAGLDSVPAEVRHLTDAEAFELSISDNMREFSELHVAGMQHPQASSECLRDKPARTVTPVHCRIDEPLCAPFCRLFLSDFDAEWFEPLLEPSADKAAHMRDLQRFHDSLEKGRLQIDSAGNDAGRILLTYIEAYLDVDEPTVAFRESLSEADQKAVTADAFRLSPIVLAAIRGRR